MIKVNLLDPDENKKDNSLKDGKDENVVNNFAANEKHNSENSYKNENYSDFDNNNVKNNYGKNDDYFKLSKKLVGWIVALLVIVIIVIVYFSYLHLSNNLPDSTFDQDDIYMEMEEDSVAIDSAIIVENEEKIEEEIVKESDIEKKLKLKYANIRKGITCSKTRLDASSKILKYIPNGLFIKYLSTSKDALTFELESNKNDLIDRYYGILHKDKNFYDIKFKSIDNKLRYSKRSRFEVKFKTTEPDIEFKLQNMNVNNFIDYIALTADNTNLKFVKILKNDVKLDSLFSIKENKLQMEFYGNIYQIREFLVKTKDIPGSIIINNIEIRNVNNKKYYKLILRILLFEKV